VSAKQPVNVSALVLTYNNVDTVTRCLNSVIGQDLNLLSEIVVWDNNSEDGTILEIQNFIKNSPIPVVLKLNQINYHNNGSGYVLDAIDLCKNDFIAVLDGDDEWILPTKTQLQIDTLISQPALNVISTRAEYFDVGKHQVSGIQPDTEYIGVNDVMSLATENFICNSTVLFRKSMIENFPSDYRFMPIKDYPLWVLGSLNKKIVVLEEVTTRYNHNHGSNVSEVNSKLDRLLVTVFTKIAITRNLLNTNDRAYWLKEISGNLNYFFSTGSRFDELTRQHDELTRQHDELTRQHDELTRQHDATVNSTIWKITKPLRQLINFVKK
jgi:glycosyltransferase involved in cell wall biosynthesis